MLTWSSLTTLLVLGSILLLVLEHLVLKAILINVIPGRVGAIVRKLFLVAECCRMRRVSCPLQGAIYTNTNTTMSRRQQITQSISSPRTTIDLDKRWCVSFLAGIFHKNQERRQEKLKMDSCEIKVFGISCQYVYPSYVACLPVRPELWTLVHLEPVICGVVG